jgi:PIN domain nuclease of toxin-antitoxin system
VSEFVLDASAVLALVREEPGAAEVAAALQSAAVSAVNLSEVVAKLADARMASEQIRDALEELDLEVTPFDSEAAYAAGFLRPTTHELGLLLADRACLALAEQLGATAVTADRRWLDLPLPVPVRPIR